MELIEYLINNPTMVIPLVGALLSAIVGMITAIIAFVQKILLPIIHGIMKERGNSQEDDSKTLAHKLTEHKEDRKQDRLSTREYLTSLNKRVDTLETQNKELLSLKDDLENKNAALLTEQRINTANFKITLDRWQVAAELYKTKVVSLEERLNNAEARLAKIDSRFGKYLAYFIDEISDEDVQRLDTLFENFIKDIRSTDE